MNRMDRKTSALVLVDYQLRLMPTLHAAQGAVDEARFLGRVALALSLPVIGTEQNPAGLGGNLPAIAELCGRTLAKLHFDATRDGLVEALVEARGSAGGELRDVVIAGCEAHVCLLQTALGLLRAGLRVTVVPAACASRRPEDHALAQQRLLQAGAVLAGAESVAFEWLDTCRAPEFKAVLALLKGRAAATRPG